MMKVAKEYTDFKGFRVQPLNLYGTVNSHDIVITSVPYAYTKSTDVFHLWILEDGKWTLQYIDAYLIEDGIVDLEGFKVGLVDYVKAIQRTVVPEELEYIYINSPIMGCVITTYRNMYGLWTIEDIFNMKKMTE